MVPDATGIFKSSGYIRALRHVVYCARGADGIALITGDAGIGKTTLCRSAVKSLSDSVRIILFEHPAGSPLELLNGILAQLGIPTSGGSRAELRMRLAEHLQNHSPVVVVLDEAQALSDDTLEEVRLLSNLNTLSTDAFKIILVGQSSLRARLAHPLFEGLSQRISVHHHLQPLRSDEIEQYIRFRLLAAGASEPLQFTRGAFRAIRRFSGGVPRLINMICDKALLAGYAAQKKRITSKMVYEAVATMYRPGRPQLRSYWSKAAARIAGALTTCTVIALLIVSLLPDSQRLHPAQPAPSAAESSVTEKLPVSPERVAAVQHTGAGTQIHSEIPTPVASPVMFGFDNDGIMRSTTDGQCAPEALATLLRIFKIPETDILEARGRWRRNWQETRLFSFHDSARPFGIYIAAQTPHSDSPLCDHCPCIVSLTDPRYHYAVLLHIDQDKAVILDPLMGKQILPNGVFRSVWGGKILSAVSLKKAQDKTGTHKEDVNAVQARRAGTIRTS